MKRNVKVLLFLFLMAASLTTMTSCRKDSGERPYEAPDGDYGYLDYESISVA